MTSSGKPYCVAFRKRALQTYLVDVDLSLRDVARIYTVAPSWIVKLAMRYNEEEGWASLEPKKSGWFDRPNTIEPQHFACLGQWSKLLPKTTLREYQCLLAAWFDLEVHQSTICRAFQRNNWVRRVTEYIHRNKLSDANVAYYRDYVGWIAQQDGVRVKFFDESNFNERVFRGKRGRTEKGVPIIEQQGRGTISKSYSLCLLTTLDQDPPFYFDIIEGSCDGSKYVEFWCRAVENFIVRAGDIVVVDNCKTHASSWSAVVVEQLLRSAGVQYVFLPAYSPELNPAEKIFAIVKKICSYLHIQTSSEMLNGILFGLRQVTMPHVLKFYQNSLGSTKTIF